MSFSVTGAHVCVVLFYFVHLFIGAGARGWVVDTAGHRGGSILQGLGCWLTVGLFWAPDLHLQRLLLTKIIFYSLTKCFNYIHCSLMKVYLMEEVTSDFIFQEIVGTYHYKQPT